MYANSHNLYQAQAVETAGPAQLVLMLYDGALAALSRARLFAGSVEPVNRELQKAQAIVTELRVTLDLERGGAIAANMAALYDFCLDRLVTANVTKDVTQLDAVEQVLRELRDGWDEACCGMSVATA